MIEIVWAVITAAIAATLFLILLPILGLNRTGEVIEKTDPVDTQNNGFPIDDEQELARLRAENEALKAKAAARQKVSFKVSPKKALAVYGLGRYPVTLYRSQWERLIQAIPDIESFIVANAKDLATREQD